MGRPGERPAEATTRQARRHHWWGSVAPAADDRGGARPVALDM